MDLKLVKLASVREHMDAHYRDEISYQKAVDLINEDANKQLKLYDVVGRSELLFDFLQYCDNAGWIKNIDKKRIIEDYEKANNSY